MSARETIILVPGLFGFTKIGDVSYFSAVRRILAESSGISHSSIFELETLPTSALWRRVSLLYDSVLERQREGSTRIHLVGHSTGGIDIRLLVNDAYLWPGGPRDFERNAFFSSIGRVVAISAPHKGTPIARRLRGAMENAVPLLFLLSILAKARAARPWLAFAEPLVFLYSSLKKGVMPHSHLKLILRLAGISEDTAREIDDFLLGIVHDHPLIHELTPTAMATLNTKIAAGLQLAISNFVTVSPPARTAFGLPIPYPPSLSPLQRLAYAFAYESTSMGPDEFGAFPGADWVGGLAPPTFERFRTTAQDGVVPAASQTMHDNPVHSVIGLVYGDHLDVVGHYPGPEHGADTVFDSGAAFDDARMLETWRAIGTHIRAPNPPAFTRREIAPPRGDQPVAG